MICDADGYIHVTDFGIAKINTKNNRKETSGTPGYMAPEVLCSQNHSFSVDFFAVGVITYEFMNGKRPYHGRNRKEMKMDILSHQVQIKENAVPKGWSKESAYFVNELLQRKVEKRLGLKGISELKEHEWMKEFNWKGVNNKKVSSPFEPYRGCDNYNKKYVESDDKIGEETKERYLHYKNDKEYESLFDNYTFNCIPKEEIIKYLKKKKKNTLNIKGKTFKKIVAKDNKGFKSDRDIRRDNNSLERVNLDNGKDLLKMFPGTMTTQKIVFNNNINPHIQSGFMLRINNNNNVIQNDRGGNVSKGIAIFHEKMRRFYQGNNNSNSSYINNINNNNNQSCMNLPFIQRNESYKGGNTLLKKSSSVSFLHQTQNAIYKHIAQFPNVNNNINNNNLNFNNGWNNGYLKQNYKLNNSSSNFFYTPYHYYN